MSGLGFLSFSAVLELKPKASTMLDKHSAAGLHPQTFSFNFETVSPYVPQAGLETVVLLPQPPK